MPMTSQNTSTAWSNVLKTVADLRAIYKQPSSGAAGQIYRDQLALEMEAALIDSAIDKDARERLY